MIVWDELKKFLDNLNILNNNYDYVKSREILKKIVPGFKSEDEIKDILHINNN